jgi:hypothetical protein
MNILRFALTAVLASASVGYVTSNPDGAGACPAGEGAPGGSHTSRTLTTGLLSDGGFSVTIDGMTPSASNKVTVNNNLNFDVVVTGTGDKTFKGILIRVGNTLSDQVTAGDGLKVAPVCGTVGSATHIDSSSKASGQATINLDGAATLNVDISVVVQNSNDVSIYYYTGYEVIVESDDSVPVCRGSGLFLRQPCGGGGKF